MRDDAQPAAGAGRLRTTFIVAAMTLLGLALRFISVDTRGLWLDESITVKQASQSIAGVVDTLGQGVHPPLFHILIHLWMTVFGRGEVAIRSYAMVFGVLAIPAAYWAGRQLYDRRTGMIAMAAAALSPYLIWYSQEARMYSMLFLAGLMSTAYLALAIRDNKRLQWVAFFFWTMMGLFTHYFFAFLIVGHVGYYVFGVLVRDERAMRELGLATASWRHPWRLFKDVPTLGPWLLANSVALAAVVAWLAKSVFVPSSNNALLSSVAGSGLGYGQEGAKLALRFNDVAAVVVQLTAGFHARATMDVLVAMWPFTITVTFLLLHLLEPGTPRTWLLMAGASGILVMLLLGQWQGQVLASRYFAAVAAPALLLAARFVAKLRRRAGIAVVALFVVLSLGSWVDQSYNPDNVMRYDNREAMGTIITSWRAGDIVLYDPYYLDSLAVYYLPAWMKPVGLPLHGRGGVLRNSAADIDHDLTRIVGSSRRVWLFLSYQDIPAVKNDGDTVGRWLRHNGFVIAHQDVLNKVELVRYDATGPIGATTTTGTAPAGGATPATTAVTP